MNLEADVLPYAGIFEGWGANALCEWRGICHHSAGCSFVSRRVPEYSSYSSKRQSNLAE